MSVPEDVRWIAEHVASGVSCLRMGVAESGAVLVAEWPGLATLVARRDGSAHELRRGPAADAEDFAKIERGPARLLLRHLDGKLGFHGAAIELGGRVVILLGHAGEGKSTLAAWACERLGARLHADDAVAVDGTPQGWSVVPLERFHWLEPDAHARVHGAASGLARPKIPVLARQIGESPRPLAACAQLVFGSGPRSRLCRLGAVESLASLIPQTVRFVLDDPRRHQRELDLLTTFLDTVPVYRLERPRDLAQLDDVGPLLLQLASPAP